MAQSPITFTSLLYGVVIGSAFQKVDTIAFGQSSVLLLLAFLIVFDDYFLYHMKLKEVAQTGLAALGIFWFDIAVLVAWYALSVATGSSVDVFFMFVFLFYSLGSLWEIIFSKSGFLERLFVDSDLLMCLLALGLAYGWRVQLIPGANYLTYVSIFLGAFMLVRIPTYVSVARS